VISPLLCPSFGGGNTVETGTLGAANVSTAPVYLNVPVSGQKVALTNYKAMAGTHLVTNMPPTSSGVGAIQLPPEGTFTGNEWETSRPGVSAGSITDGMSKTVLIAETREKGFSSWIDGTACWVVAYSPTNTPTLPVFDTGNWRVAAGSTQALISQCALTVQPTDSIRYVPAANFGTSRVVGGIAYGPSSDHQGGIVLHAFGDTHVAQVTSDVDANVYLSICSRSAGEANTLQE
jgi:hypothetical protein